jgi:putative ABC transport system permease protein
LLNLDERRNNAILFRALGVSRQKIWAILLSEFLIIGGLAGLIASLVASILYLYLGNALFHLPVKIQPGLLLMGPLVGMLLLCLGSFLGLRKVFKVTPREALSSR